MNLKILIALLIMAVAAHAQDYNLTNMFVAPTITNNSVFSYTGTNFVDATRHREVGWEHRAHGPGVETNNYVYTFRLGADRALTNAPAVSTNWTGAELTWVASGAYDVTYFTLGPVGFIQPHQRTSTNAVDHTNSTLRGILKGYRRD